MQETMVKTAIVSIVTGDGMDIGIDVAEKDSM